MAKTHHTQEAWINFTDDEDSFDDAEYAESEWWDEAGDPRHPAWFMCDGSQHVWTRRDDKLTVEGDKCDCGQATWADPEIPEDQAQAARGAPRLPGMRGRR